MPGWKNLVSVPLITPDVYFPFYFAMTDLNFISRILVRRRTKHENLLRLIMELKPLLIINGFISNCNKSRLQAVTSWIVFLSALVQSRHFQSLVPLFGTITFLWSCSKTVVIALSFGRCILVQFTVRHFVFWQTRICRRARIISWWGRRGAFVEDKAILGKISKIYVLYGRIVL